MQCLKAANWARKGNILIPSSLSLCSSALLSQPDTDKGGQRGYKSINPCNRPAAARDSVLWSCSPISRYSVSKLIIITIKNLCLLPWATLKHLRPFQSTLLRSDLALPFHFSLLLLPTCSTDPFSQDHTQPTQSVLFLGTSQGTFFSLWFLFLLAIPHGMESNAGYRILWQQRKLRLHQIQHLGWLEKLKRNKVAHSGPTKSIKAFTISLKSHWL